MRDALTFLATAAALLAAPGPTNALLAASGVSVGLRRSLALVACVVAGYALSITTLAVLVGPVLRASPPVALALRLACGLWLALNALTLWRGGAAAPGAAVVGPWRVFVTTLLNPKGAVLAFAVLPHLAAGRYREALPYGAALGAVIALVSAAWVALGAAVLTGAKGRLDARLVRRLSAGVVGIFALAVLRG